MAQAPEELSEEPQPPRGHVRVVYLGPVAPHWQVVSDFGDRNVIEELSQRILARLLLLPPHDPQFGGRAGLESGLAKLERVVDSTVAVASEANSARSLMEEALAAVPHGVVVGDDEGAVVFQNAPAADLLGQNGSRSSARRTVA